MSLKKLSWMIMVKVKVTLLRQSIQSFSQTSF